MLVREDHGRGELGQLRRINGERGQVEEHAVAAGTLELSDAIVHWWVLDDDHHGRRREAVLWGSSGHVGAVFDDELYDVLPQTRGGYGRLQDFGIRFGYERVILHLEPQVHVGRLEANTARTLLLLDHQQLPWSRWGEEFACAMPAEILRLQERVASADGVPRQEAIRNRVSAILPLYRLSRYRPTPPGGQPPRQAATDTCVESPADSRATGTPALRRQPTPDRAATPADAGRRYEPSGGEPLTMDADSEERPQPMVRLPDVAWISARDGSRAPGDLEDQAARYHPARHELTINADFRAITDLIGHWRQRYRGVPGARTVIEALVREWCEQILIEVVLAARNSRWREEQLDALLSPTSLTAALLPRHFLHATIKKRLGQKLGTPQNTISATTTRTCAVNELGDLNGHEDDS